MKLIFFVNHKNILQYIEQEHKCMKKIQMTFKKVNISSEQKIFWEEYFFNLIKN
jgi:hypothetical protein